jgi:cytoskeletal protein CcmA (bactofilin family)
LDGPTITVILILEHLFVNGCVRTQCETAAGRLQVASHAVFVVRCGCKPVCVPRSMQINGGLIKFVALRSSLAKMGVFVRR